ncbi:MAG: hypothetical protein AABX34_00900 [Nanoarchaeota archaeon]
MKSSAVDQNRGLVTLPDSSRLELMVLDSDTPEEDVAAFVDIFNNEWLFQPIVEETFRKRVERGTLIGAYLGQKPATLLETTSLNLEGIAEIEEAITGYKERAYEVCKLLHKRIPRGYYDLTNNGEWHENEANSNVLVMVDITTPQHLQGNGLATALINYFIAIMLEQKGFQCPSHLKNIKYVFPFTPKPDGYTDINYSGGSLRLHLGNGAFNTGYILPNARLGHPEYDVVFPCYLAPGYVPKLGDMAIHRNVGSGMPIPS